MASDLETAERLSVLMQRVGFALWQLQELENTAAAYIVVRLRDTRGVGKAGGAAISAEVERLPLGKLVNELADAAVIDPGLALRLKGLLEDRNWLAHRSRRESRGVLVNESIYSALSKRLDDIAERALALTKELGVRFEEDILQAGVDRAIVDREADRLARAWGLLE